MDSLMEQTKFVPGFRFHPTDVELAKYYLKRKVMGKRFPVDVIAEVDIYKYAPWDLPDKSSLSTGDLEWYFFCPKGTKYASGARMNRATEDGFWKTTGRDRPIQYNNQTVGMIKTLIFHVGRAPRGDRTDWVMHEYKLQDKELTDKGIPQDSYVLCKVFQKDGPGPRNGAHYGKPFNEEEWDTDEVAPGGEEPVLSAALSAPVSMVPAIQYNSDVIDLHLIGQSSVSCTSGPKPSPTNEEAPGGEEPVLSAALPATVSMVPATQYNSVATDLHLINCGCIGQSSVSCASGPRPSPTDEEAPTGEEPVLSAALLGPVSMVPATQYNSDVIDLHLIDHGCTGQSSVSCASGPKPSPSPSPSPSPCIMPDSGTSDQVITYEKFGVPDDNVMAVMLDYSGEDNTLASCGNNNTEVLDNCGWENNATSMPCFDINNFLKDLGDLDNLAGMGVDGYCSTFDQQAEKMDIVRPLINLAGMGEDGNRSIFDQQAENSTNQMFPTLDYDDFLKLDDLDFPLFNVELDINLIENEKERR